VPFRGLPDLTFSEMSFLKHRRAANETRLKAQQQEKETKSKSRTSKNDLSQYFAQPTSQVSDHSVFGDDNRHRNGRREASRPRPPSILSNQEQYWQDPDHLRHPLLDLDLNSVKKHRNQTRDRLSHGARISHGIGDVKTPSERATSYVSWSPTVEPCHQPYIVKAEQLDTEPNVFIHHSHGPELRARTVHPRSSVSNIGDSSVANIMMERYLKGIVRPKSRPRTATRQYYDLEDLKILASLLPDDPEAEYDALFPRRPFPPPCGPIFPEEGGSEHHLGPAPAEQLEEDNYQHGRKIWPRSHSPGYRGLPSKAWQETSQGYHALENITPHTRPMQYDFDAEPGSVDVSSQYYEGYFPQNTETATFDQRECCIDSRIDLQDRNLDDFDLQLLRSPHAEYHPTEQRPQEYIDITAIDTAGSAAQHQYRRPQLLRPSEQESCDPEPFTGFSQPNLFL
jgi:hypothetical protein